MGTPSGQRVLHAESTRHSVTRAWLPLESATHSLRNHVGGLMQAFDGFPALPTTGVRGRTPIHRVISQT